MDKNLIARDSPLSPPEQGENSAKPVARFEPLNRNNDRGSVSLSSPKGGEGGGEEVLGFRGNHIGCSPVHGEGRGEGLSHHIQGRYFPMTKLYLATLPITLNHTRSIGAPAPRAESPPCYSPD